MGRVLTGLLNPFLQLVLQIKLAHWPVAGEEFQFFHLTMNEVHAVYGLFVDEMEETLWMLAAQEVSA